MCQRRKRPKVVDKRWRGARADGLLTLLSKREMRLGVEQGPHLDTFEDLLYSLYI